MATRSNITVTLDIKTIEALDKMVAETRFRSKSHAVQEACNKMLNTPGAIPGVRGKNELAKKNAERAEQLVFNLREKGVVLVTSKPGAAATLEDGCPADLLEYLDLEDHQWFYQHKELCNAAFRKLFGSYHSDRVG